ncbi:hypothetical protein [Nocardia tengchongensis]|uniref:hypothetical protein n=1 Tax=Nocardia tengchongensis TaxID=2055889 RepID=UPI00368C90EF
MPEGIAALSMPARWYRPSLSMSKSARHGCDDQDPDLVKSPPAHRVGRVKACTPKALAPFVVHAWFDVEQGQGVAADMRLSAIGTDLAPPCARMSGFATADHAELARIWH